LSILVFFIGLRSVMPQFITLSMAIVHSFTHQKQQKWQRLYYLQHLVGMLFFYNSNRFWKSSDSSK